MPDVSAAEKVKHGKSNETYILVPQILLGNTLDIFYGDCVNSVLNLLGSVATPSSNELATNIFGNCGETVETEEQASFELALCALHLCYGRPGAHASPFLESEVYEVIDVTEILRDKVNTPEAGVGITGGEREVTVGEVVT